MREGSKFVELPVYIENIFNLDPSEIIVVHNPVVEEFIVQRVYYQDSGECIVSVPQTISYSSVDKGHWTALNDLSKKQKKSNDEFTNIAEDIAETIDTELRAAAKSWFDVSDYSRIKRVYAHTSTETSIVPQTYYTSIQVSRFASERVIKYVPEILYENLVKEMFRGGNPEDYLVFCTRGIKPFYTIYDSPSMVTYGVHIYADVRRMSESPDGDEKQQSDWRDRIMKTPPG